MFVLIDRGLVAVEVVDIYIEKAEKNIFVKAILYVWQLVLFYVVRSTPSPSTPSLQLVSSQGLPEHHP